jgi:hypothetical protein
LSTVAVRHRHGYLSACTAPFAQNSRSLNFWILPDPVKLRKITVTVHLITRLGNGAHERLSGADGFGPRLPGLRRRPVMRSRRATNRLNYGDSALNYSNYGDSALNYSPR